MRQLSVLLTSSCMLFALSCDSSSSSTDDAGSTASTGSTDNTGGTDSTTGTDTGGGGMCPGLADQAGMSCEQGQKIFEIELQDCEGNLVKLSDRLCGTKAALVYMGAGWCQPCRDKMPTVKKWKEDYGAQGFKPIVILRENEGPNDPATKAFCESWKTQYSLDFDVLIDPLDRVTSDCLGSGTFPVTMVVDGEWNVQYKSLGDADDTESVIQALVQ